MRIDSLNKKTILLIFILTIVCISGSVFMVSQIIEKQAMNKYKLDKETSIEVLSYSLAPMLDLYDYKQVEHLITSSLSYEKIVSVAVFDDSGTLIKSAAKNNVTAKDLDMEKRKITTSLEGIIGSIEIGFSKKYIHDRIRAVTAALIFGLMGGFVLLGLGLYILMRHYIIKPLESLTNTVKEMTFENLSSRVKIFRKDEIGTLAKSFNHMADNLEKSHRVLRESENKYRSMMEAMNDAVYICSSDYRIEYMNPAMIKKTGQNAVGELCFKAIFDLNEQCPWCRHNKIQQGKSLAFDVVDPQGNQFYHASNAAIVHSNGTISMLAVLRDTSELKNLEAQLLQAQKMESIGTLAAGIAHDFNNILSAIFGYTEIALRKIPSDSSLENSLNKVLQAAKRARDLVKQILTFSRKSEKEKKPVQVHLIVNEILKFLRSSLPSTIQIQQQIEIDNDIVWADSTQIHQILMNLCTNASHAMMEKGGILQVNLENMELNSDFTAQYPDIKPGPYLKITVSDTGHGMSSDVLNKIFEPYFTTKEKGSGTGLGMAVVHGIIKNHSGCIKVDSKPGKGAVFYVYLPVINEEETSEKETDQPIPTGNERILFIDDEDILVDLGKQLLEKLGYKVVALTSSVEALEIFRAEPDRFDLVITDMTMPKMTGDSLAKELMKINTDIPIILCTGYSNGISEYKAKKMGIRAFVMKPFVMRELSLIVRKVLDEA
ncbi:MAG: response regulator [Desulfobacula sp.]|uniref:hybrid sensor histidine kinase/response regulator n=1 Tax=Desulfobacula sp. TaxID=2593537 RepID=UPI0025B87BD4|nr:response regulator [Desulfobacula sp.]MCD4718948.1 response regulator [Desulfobacula sp.]